MEKSEHLPNLPVLFKEAFAMYKKNILLYGVLLLLIYIFLIPNIIWNTYSSSVSGMWAAFLSILSFLGQIVSLYFVIAFIRSLISLSDGDTPSFRKVLPSLKQSIRPLATMVVLAIVSMPVFAIIGGAGLLMTATIVRYSIMILLLSLIMLFVVFLVSFIITGTFLFSVRYELWPFRALRDFIKSTKGKFMALFARYLGIFSIMLVLVVLLAVLIGFLYGDHSINSLPFTVVLFLSVFFLMPLVYFALVRMIFHQVKIDTSLPAEQLLEVMPPTGV